MGLDRPTAGTATVNGTRYAELATPLNEVGALLDAGAMHPGRTGRAHLRIGARTNGIPLSRVGEVIEQVGLGSAAGRRIKGYSLGMRQRLGIAAALLGDPQVLLFDEPVNGLDLDGVRWIRALFRGFADEGRTVLVSSHLMSEMQLIADRVVIIGRGRLIADADTGDVLRGLGGSARAGAYAAGRRPASRPRRPRGRGAHRTRRAGGHRPARHRGRRPRVCPRRTRAPPRGGRAVARARLSLPHRGQRRVPGSDRHEHRPSSPSRTGRAEWGRIWSVRSSWILALVTAVAVVGLGTIIGLDAASRPASPPTRARGRASARRRCSRSSACSPCPWSRAPPTTAPAGSCRPCSGPRGVASCWPLGQASSSRPRRSSAYSSSRWPGSWR